jgi:hypothetical protein
MVPATATLHRKCQRRFPTKISYKERGISVEGECCSVAFARPPERFVLAAEDNGGKNFPRHVEIARPTGIDTYKQSGCALHGTVIGFGTAFALVTVKAVNHIFPGGIS